MERQAGLGRSLHEVLESLTPADDAPGRVLFESDDGATERVVGDGDELVVEALPAVVDRLVDDVEELRSKVRHLSAVVDDGASRMAVEVTVKSEPAELKKHKKHKKDKGKKAERADKKSKGKKGKKRSKD